MKYLDYFVLFSYGNILSLLSLHDYVYDTRSRMHVYTIRPKVAATILNDALTYSYATRPDEEHHRVVGLNHLTPRGIL